MTDAVPSSEFRVPSVVLVSQGRLEALERLERAALALREQFGDIPEHTIRVLEPWAGLFNEYDDAIDALEVAR